MPRNLEMHEPPACTTPEGLRDLNEFMAGLVTQLIAKGGDPGFTSPDNRGKDGGREKALGIYV